MLHVSWVIEKEATEFARSTWSSATSVCGLSRGARKNGSHWASIQAMFIAHAFYSGWFFLGIYKGEKRKYCWSLPSVLWWLHLFWGWWLSLPTCRTWPKPPLPAISWYPQLNVTAPFWDSAALLLRPLLWLLLPPAGHELLVATGLGLTFPAVSWWVLVGDWVILGRHKDFSTLLQGLPEAEVLPLRLW